MTESTTTAVFPIVAEGYDPVKVNRYVAEAATGHRRPRSSTRSTCTPKMSAQSEGDEPAELNFDTLGSHIANLVKAAHEAANGIRRDAEAEARATAAAAERAILLRRADAESEVQRLTEVGEEELEKARISAAAIRNNAAKVLADADEKAAATEAAARKKVAEITQHRDEIFGRLRALHERLPDVLAASTASDEQPTEEAEPPAEPSAKAAEPAEPTE